MLYEVITGSLEKPDPYFGPVHHIHDYGLSHPSGLSLLPEILPQGNHDRCGEGLTGMSFGSIKIKEAFLMKRNLVVAAMVLTASLLWSNGAGDKASKEDPNELVTLSAFAMQSSSGVV